MTSMASEQADYDHEDTADKCEIENVVVRQYVLR